MPPWLRATRPPPPPRPLLPPAAAPLPRAACAPTKADMQADAAMAAGNMTPTQRGAYVEMAAASDLFEIQSGRMAAERGQNAAVRQFGSMLVDHHQRTTAQVSAAAGARRTRPPHTAAQA